MPIYEYRCSSLRPPAGIPAEGERRAAHGMPRSAASPRSPRCSRAAGFQLKGSGWYATDFRQQRLEARREIRGSRSDGRNPTAKSDGRSPSKPRQQVRSPRPDTETATARGRAGKADSANDDVDAQALLHRRPAGLDPARHHAVGAQAARRPHGPVAAACCPRTCRSDALFGFHVPGLGIILTVVDRARHGRARGQLLRHASSSRLGDSLLSRIPIVRSIYGGVKQISDTLFSPEGKAFRRAVLVRYPHAGTWTVALVTGTPQHEVARSLGSDQISVFVPTTPNITAGFFLVVPRSDTIELEMTVDDALKYIISMGVAEPAPRKAGPRGTPPGPTPIGGRRRERRRRRGDQDSGSRQPIWIPGHALADAGDDTTKCAPNTAAIPTPDSSARP